MGLDIKVDKGLFLGALVDILVLFPRASELSRAFGATSVLEGH